MNQLIKKLLIFLISVTTSNQALAETVQLTKGQPAPYAGYLMDNQTTLKVREDLLQLEACFKTAESLNKSLGTCTENKNYMEQQVKLLYVQNTNLSKQLEVNKSLNTWEKAFWAGVGALVLGGAIYLGRQIP